MYFITTHVLLAVSCKDADVRGLGALWGLFLECKVGTGTELTATDVLRIGVQRKLTLLCYSPA